MSLFLCLFWPVDLSSILTATLLFEDYTKILEGYKSWTFENNLCCCFYHDHWWDETCPSLGGLAEWVALWLIECTPSKSTQPSGNLLGSQHPGPLIPFSSLTGLFIICEAVCGISYRTLQATESSTFSHLQFHGIQHFSSQPFSYLIPPTPSFSTSVIDLYYLLGDNEI